MSNRNNNSSVPVKLPSEEIIKQMLQNEAKKLELQEKRFVFEEANQKRQHEYACKALEAQKEILKDKPKEQRKTVTRFSIIASVVLIVLLGFFAYCIYMNKEQIVLDIVKYLGLALLSFVGGVYYGKNKKDEANTTAGIPYADEIKS